MKRLFSRFFPSTAWRKRIKRTILILLAVSILYLCSFASAIHIVGLIDHAENADVIIVLGAGLNRSGRPGWALTRRAEFGAELWQEGKAHIVICTGAQAENYPRSEADACKELLLKNGVSESAIVMEDQSHSTEENALYSHEIMQQHGWETAILVSDSYHMLRAEWIFRQEGISAYTHPVPFNHIVYPLSYPGSIFREIAAIHWQVFKQVFNIPVTHIYGV